MVHQTRHPRRVLAGIVALLALLALAGWQIGQTHPAAPGATLGRGPLGSSATGAGAGVPNGPKPPEVAANGPIIVGQSSKNDVSPPLRDTSVARSTYDSSAKSAVSSGMRPTMSR